MISGDNGISWWQSWLCVWIGYTIAGCFICMTGRIGATYHISFPIVSRASFGIWGSLWPVFNRAAMACIWYGVQSWIGGLPSPNKPPNIISLHANPTTRRMRDSNASRNLDQVRGSPKHFPLTKRQHPRLRLLLPLLVLLAPSNLVSRP